MRKLKLQVQMTVDGFIAGPNGEMDWLVWNWDEELKEYVWGIMKSVDTILLGRVLAEGFIPTWASKAADPETDASEIEAAHWMTDTHKIVFSHTLETTKWDNTELAKGDLAEELAKIKGRTGGDLIAYGGGNFVSNLIEQELIDELHLFVNPVAIGSGMPIFKGRTKLELVRSQAFSCGIVVLVYRPAGTTE